VDVFEKISVLFNASGYVINSSIEGCIQMKSYLTGNPPLRLALNEDLVVKMRLSLLEKYFLIYFLFEQDRQGLEW